LQEPVKRIFENFARGNRLRSRKNGFARRSKHRKDETTDAHDLITHDVLIPNPFSLKTAKNFNSSPPFGLYDIFQLSDLPLHRLRQGRTRRLQVISRLSLIR